MIKEYDYSDLTKKIIAAYFEVHRSLGPGFPERIYLNALKIIFEKRGLKYESEKEFAVKFQDVHIGKFRVDLLIEDKVVVEIKSIETKLPKIFESQLISYLKASGLKVGLLVNFGSISCQIRRLLI